MGDSGHRRDAEIRRSVLLAPVPHEAAQIRSRPRVADPDQVRFGLVPRDFVIGAIDQLSTMDVAVVGKPRW